MRATVGKLSALLALGTLSAAPRGSLGQGGGGSDDDDALNVYCEEDGSSAHYDEVLSGSGSMVTRWAASDTGCPNHVNWDINPNDAQHQPTNMSIPAYPMMFASGGTADLSSTAGAVGIMRNGVVMFSAWTRVPVVEYEDTAFYLESASFDLCGGHATGNGNYHYHATPGCLQEQAAVAAGTSTSEHSALLGWAYEYAMIAVGISASEHSTLLGLAYDGFPIYGQLGPDGVEMKMCNLDGADSTACLDVCSGYEALLPDVDDFAYRYYTSCGFDESFFPFTTNCFRGCCPDGVTCSRKMEACGDSPENGFTADYVPTLTTPLDEQYDTDLIEGDDTDVIDTRMSVDCTLFMGGQTPAPTAPAPTPAPMEPPSPSPVPTPRPITVLTPGPITILTSSSMDPPSPTPVPTPPPVITILTPSPITQLASSLMGFSPTPAPIAPEFVVPSSPAEPLTPASSEMQPPVPESDSETSSEYDDDSGYVEVGTKTTVDVTATAYDGNPGEDFGDTGCGMDGCMPALAHDGDSSDLESRWSCAESIAPDGGVCEITFVFGEPMDLKDVQVAFFKGEERTRWLKISINGDEIGTFESYAGSTFNSFDIEETEVESLTMESVGIAATDWIAFLEVRFMVEP